MKGHSQIISYLGVMGVESLVSHDLEASENYCLSSLRLLHTSQPPPDSDLTHHIDLNGDQRLFLQCNYNYSPSLLSCSPPSHPSSPPSLSSSPPKIISLSFMYCPVLSSSIQVEPGYSPIPLETLPSQPLETLPSQLLETLPSQPFPQQTSPKDNLQVLHSASDSTQHLVLCVKYQTDLIEQAPIHQVDIVKAEKINNNYSKNQRFSYQLNIDSDATMIQFALGVTQKNRFLVTKKQQKSIFEIAFQPQFLDSYPKQGFPDAVSQFCFPSGIMISKEMQNPIAFSFMLTKEDGSRIYGACLQFSEEIDPALLDKKNVNSIYIMKALCLISNFNYINQYVDILKQLYRIQLSPSKVPIERVIGNIIDDIRYPAIDEFGKSLLQFEIGQKIVEFETNLNYPLVNKQSLVNLFRVLDVKKIMMILTGMLLEKKIVLISSKKSLITQVTDALLGLLHPYQWLHILIPMLPFHLRAYLDAPVPFIIGIEDNHLQHLNLSHSSDLLQVYLDSNDIICIDSLPSLPEKPRKTLLSRLKTIDTHLHKGIDNITCIDNAFDLQLLQDQFQNDFDLYNVRDAFFEFHLSFLNKYQKYIINYKESYFEFSEIFNVRQFLIDNKSNKVGSFLYYFVDTQVFTHFIESRLRTTSIQEQHYYNFLDDCFKQKRTKKQPYLLKQSVYQKVLPIGYPDESNLPQVDNMYRYDKFPSLNPELFRKKMERICTQESQQNLVGLENNNKVHLAKVDLKSLDDNQWVIKLLEEVHTLWLVCLNLRAKFNYQPDLYQRLVVIGLERVKELKGRGININLIMQKALIEVAAIYEKQDVINRLQELSNQTKHDSLVIHRAFSTAIAYKQQLKGNKQKEEEEEEQEIESSAFSFKEVVCAECVQQLDLMAIFCGWQKSDQSYVTSCPYCQAIVKPKMTIHSLGQISRTPQVQTRQLLSPVLVRKELDNLIQQKGLKALSRQNLWNGHALLFWNIVFYSRLVQLPLFFFQSHPDPQFYSDTLQSFQHFYKSAAVSLFYSTNTPLPFIQIQSPIYPVIKKYFHYYFNIEAYRSQQNAINIHKCQDTKTQDNQSKNQDNIIQKKSEDDYSQEQDKITQQQVEKHKESYSNYACEDESQNQNFAINQLKHSIITQKLQ